MQIQCFWGDRARRIFWRWCPGLPGHLGIGSHGPLTSMIYRWKNGDFPIANCKLTESKIRKKKWNIEKIIENNEHRRFLEDSYLLAHQILKIYGSRNPPISASSGSVQARRVHWIASSLWPSGGDIQCQWKNRGMGNGWDLTNNWGYIIYNIYILYIIYLYIYINIYYYYIIILLFYIILYFYIIYIMLYYIMLYYIIYYILYIIYYILNIIYIILYIIYYILYIILIIL